MPTIISTNPSCDFSVIGEVPVTSEEQVIKIVQKSREVQKAWADLPV